MWVELNTGSGWKMKLARRGNGQMAKNLTTGEFQDISLCSQGCQLPKLAAFLSFKVLFFMRVVLLEAEL